MNDDFTSRLPFGFVDYRLLALAINRFVADTGWTLSRIGGCCGLTKMTVSRAARGHTVNATTVLKLCIVLDLNPFELLTSGAAVSRGHGTVTAKPEARADG